MKRSLSILMIAIALLGNGYSDRGSWVIDTDSQLVIYGSTNINNFVCKMDCYVGSDTLQYFKEYSSKEIRFSKNRMSVPVTSFDCGARQISRDFWKTLKSEFHPKLHITFISLQDIALQNNSCVNGIVNITLAGATSRYSIDYQVTRSKNIILLKGTQSVNFSDFNLQAPEKLQGLIKVSEALKVEPALRRGLG